MRSLANTRGEKMITILIGPPPSFRLQLEHLHLDHFSVAQNVLYDAGDVHR